MSYKILRHPDKEQIIKWLSEGRSVREVENLISDKYPKANQAKLRIGASALNDFRKNYLNFDEKVSKEVQQVASKTLFKKQEIERELAKSPTYQELIREAAVKEIDVSKEILKIFSILEARMESLFDQVTDPRNKDKDKERIFQTYIAQFMKALDQHKKYVEGYREQVDVNVNVSVMSEQIAILREALREILSEIDVNLVPMFMNKLNAKMKDLSWRESATSSKHAAILDRQLIGETFES